MKDAFYHDSHDIFYRSPFGAVECGRTVDIRLNTTESNIGSVILRLWKNESSEEKIIMEKLEPCNGQIIYQTKITVPEHAGLLWYYFIIKANDKMLYYGNNPEHLGGAGCIYGREPPSFQVTVYKKGAQTPVWFKDSIMYQIFMDRFYNGNEDGQVNNWQKDSIIHENWFDTPNFLPDPKTGENLCNDFFGGNLLGIIKKLPYLKDLGIDVLYLNPIFQSRSNHKYNTGDYMKVDPMFGDESILSQLVYEAKKAGISIILDGVFSHTGSDSLYFNRYGNYPSLGAYQSKESPYYKWYGFNRYPDDYDCWWGIDTLPNVDELEPSYKEFILGDKGVIRHWMELGIKGWRLDVADELPDEFIKELKAAVKNSDNDGVVIGEVWEDASNKISYGVSRQYLFGDELDSVMNYRLMDGILGFFTGKIDGMNLNRIVMSLYENYPPHCFYSMMNILGTHDTCRAKFTLGGIAYTPGSISRNDEALLELSREQEEIAVKRLKLASLFQMTFPGVPSIYYGDEAGLGGGRDPFDRKTYPWGRENNELLDWYKKICSIRHQIDALRTGDFIPIYYSEDTYGYIRLIENETDVFGSKKENGFVLSLFNRSSDKTHNIIVDISKWNINKLYDILHDNKELTQTVGCFDITLPPLEGLVLYNRL